VLGSAHFIGAGDFDGDGHWDVVSATRGESQLHFLSGDGHGAFKEPRDIEVAGGVTVMTVGEINRRDGLADVIVGITGPNSAHILVFEGPEGALRAKPEVFDIADKPTSLALGQLGLGYEMDLAVAAGNDLLIVYGRDRQLCLSEGDRSKAEPTRIIRRTLPFSIKSIQIGDFTGSHQSSIALLGDEGQLSIMKERKRAELNLDQTDDLWQMDFVPSVPKASTELVRARMSNLNVDDLVVIESDGADSKFVIVSKNRSSQDQSAALNYEFVSFAGEGQVAAAISARLNSDAMSDLILLRSGTCAPSVLTTAAFATFAVTNTNDSGVGSLRQAVVDANNNPGADRIEFNIPGPGPYTITLATGLPDITDPVTLDGTSQPGFSGSPIIELSGANSSLVGDG